MQGHCRRRRACLRPQAVAVPAVLALVLPLHYSMPVPVGVYIAWMTLSVFWQNYLTFGLPQSYVRDYLPAWVSIVVVTAMFWLGHVVVLPDQFGPGNLLASLAMVVGSEQPDGVALVVDVDVRRGRIRAKARHRAHLPGDRVDEPGAHRGPHLPHR